ncbi:MAG: poly-gamma-glutamate system protein [Bacteroidales bacterium]|nr:poly-gamma-glutamate system protein [Bacteroidales bacterium]MCF8457862.1 poly-gamma-glutamate system protein [Bacteroidales bacterium]
MYKFRAKSNIVLTVLSVLSLLAFIAVENGKVEVKQKWYAEKLEAAELSQLAANTLKEYRLGKGVFIDAINDPNNTALIGQEYTLVTTDRGYIEAKLSSTNPNFAAVIVQLLKDAGLKEKDNVAVAMTGSFPGLNISIMAALEALDLKPIVITSVGASNFGANDPYFTWLDMENVLYESNVFHTKSVAASMGGGADIGRGLSPEGRELIVKAIERNDVELIQEDHLENSIAKRMKIYQKESGQTPIKAFINVGGGIASLGNTVNGKIIPAGLTELLPQSNFPVRGVMIQMGQNEIPIIHLLNINQLLTKYGLPFSPVPLPEPGEGEIFVQEKYSVVVTSVSVLILLIVIIFVYVSERKQHQLGTEIVSGANNPKPKEEENVDILSL